MKRVLLSAILGVFILGSAFAATSVKYVFQGAQFRDASGQVVATGTIQAGVKTTRKTQVITCNYFVSPNDQYAGDFETDDPTINADSAAAVLNVCETNYANRQVVPR